MTAMLPILEALTDVVSSVRATHSGIPEVMIVLGASAPTKHGHFAANTWALREGEGTVHEIMLSGESLKRGGLGTFGTIVHELAHAYCNHNGIQDTSNRGRYHNREFKAVAERFGLNIEKADTIGFSVTSVPRETQEMYAGEIRHLDEAINHYRVNKVVGDEVHPRAKYRMSCDCGGEPTPVSKRFLLMDMTCNFCDEPMVVTVNEP